MIEIVRGMFGVRDGRQVPMILSSSTITRFGRVVAVPFLSRVGLVRGTLCPMSGTVVVRVSERGH